MIFWEPFSHLMNISTSSRTILSESTALLNMKFNEELMGKA